MLPDREVVTKLSLSYEECDENRSITNHLFGMILNIMETATELNTLESPANGTDDREARSFRWYAARTQMNCEVRGVRSGGGGEQLSVWVEVTLLP